MADNAGVIPVVGQAATPAPVDPGSREGTVQFWVSKGAPRHVAEGIADRVATESGFRPTIPGDHGTSVGLYQHHADRMQKLQSQPNWQHPLTQHQFSYSEVTGGDSIATKHWDEIKSAKTREEAARLWDKYFERSAGGVGGGGGAGGGTRRMPGRLGGMGPMVATEGGGISPIPTGDRLGRALGATDAQSPPAVAQPVQAAPAAMVPAPAHHIPALQPIPIPQAPNLQVGLRDALAMILGGGGRRPMGNLFGQ